MSSEDSDVVGVDSVPQNVEVVPADKPLSGYAKRKAKDEARRKKTNKEFASEVPADLYVVYSSGKWRVYRTPLHATRRFAALKKGCRAAKMIKYSVLEIVRE